MARRTRTSLHASDHGAPRKPRRKVEAASARQGSRKVAARESRQVAASSHSARRSAREEEQARPVPVIALGASAGGLEAFSQLLSRLPSACGVAFVLVQHLDPDHESLLSRLLAKKSALPVVQVGARVRVRPDHVYVTPAARSMKLDRGFLRTAALHKSARGSSLIDEFFISVAKSLGKHAVGVLLSGTGHDGVAGLKAIQAAGGTTLCQSPESAQMGGMPQAAISAQAADIVLDLPTLAAELVRIGQALSSAGSEREPKAEGGPIGDLADVIAALHTQTSLDFSSYKQSTVKRRLARRMSLGRFSTVASYADHLRSDPREAAELAEDLLIHVTKFFRDPAMFAALKRIALPRLMRDRGGHEPLRIWVAGCATGEEVYSLAIAVLRYLEGKAERPNIQIFGTDISEVAIAKARAALYPDKIRGDVPADLLRKYFVKVDGGYQVARQVRSLCAFARHDMTLDPPFSRLDLISCRNVLIYHTAEAQQRALSLFHYALLPKGILILGSSESSGARADLFAPLANRERIFVKKSSRVSTTFRVPVGAEPRQVHALAGGGAVTRGALTQLACKEADRILLGRIAPASVLIDPDLQILQFRGQAGPYIRPTSGAASLSVLKMVHPSLAPELRSALRPVRGAIKTTTKVISLEVDGAAALSVRMEILPIHVGQAEPRHALVMFHPLPAPALAPEQLGPRRPPAIVAQLRRELTRAHDQLQSMMLEHEAATEALQAALESGQSTNEELQSTNEELETAKEELQSTNEELSTVNDELQARNLELNQLNNDLVHVLASIDTPVLTLSRDGRIRRFNRAAERALDLSPGDVGRALSDVHIALPGVDLAKLVAQVVKDGVPAEKEVMSREQRPYLLCARPYPLGSAGVEGVIVLLIARQLGDSFARRGTTGTHATSADKDTGGARARPERKATRRAARGRRSKHGSQ